MNGTEIITFLENNAPLIKSAVSAVTGSLLTAIFLRHNTAAEEFEKIKAGHFKEVADDLLATGGTVEAIVKLVEKQQAKVAGIGFVIELDDLKGREKFKGDLLDGRI